MKRLLASAVLALAATFGSSAGAATLGLPTTTPTITASGSISGFGSGDFLIFSFSPVSTDIMFDPFSSLSINLTASDPVDPALGAMGSLALDEIPGGSVLGGTLIDVGFVANTIELQFGSLTGSAASGFGPTLLATIESPDFGANPFQTFANNQGFVDTDVFVTIANVVPLPGALWLALSGFAGFAWIRRRKTVAV